MYIVYQTTNVLTNEFYIGTHKTENPTDGYLGSGTRLKENIEQYGRENFIRRIIATFNDAQLALQLEHQLVTDAKISPLCLNVTNGGMNFDFINEHNLNNSVSNAQLGARALIEKRMSDANFNEFWLSQMKNGFTDEVRKKLSNASKGRQAFLNHKHSENTKLKMSLKAHERTGSKNSQFGTFWITNGVINKKWADKLGAIPENFYKGRVMPKQ